MRQLCRLIAPSWLLTDALGTKKVIEAELTIQEIKKYNEQGYNVYFFPNCPKEYHKDGPIDGTQIDKWSFVFVDYDVKSSIYPSKDDFLTAIGESDITPTSIIDSGNGIHVYWQVSDLTAESYLRLQRRLIRKFKTDEAVSSICQLMRLQNTLNTKVKDHFLKCEEIWSSDQIYTCEDLDKLLPNITPEDERFCQQHYDKVYKIDRNNITVNEAIPAKFGKLLNENHEVKELWVGVTDDRSKNDYRLGHIMFANDFTKEEAASVLVNSGKAMQRAPVHRVNYAQNIIDKIWTFEKEPDKSQLTLSDSVKNILQKSGSTLKGTPFRCHRRIDNTVHGFRLGQVIGLVAGSGVGKTAFALNMFKWFCEENPDYHHFFIPLEQPSNEIADRWNTMTKGDTSLNEKVHVLSNYDDDGGFRHLSFEEIRQYIEKWQTTTGKKIGCIVIDHIGALKKKGAKDENQDLMTICHSMKAFAIQTNTLLVMQSQSSREKAGIGDLELNKDAAYGTIFFESYCDYLITLWQPLKRVHSMQNCPLVTAYKFCKIRHKKAGKDIIQEDTPYYFLFDSDQEVLKDMTEDNKTQFKWFNEQAIKKRSKDRKTELVEYKSVPYEGEKTVATPVSSNRQQQRH